MRSSVCVQCARPAFGYAPISRFSRTVRVLNTCRPSGTCAMPRCARSEARRDSRSSPPNVMVPDTGGTTPLIVLNRVDLPAPFGPDEGDESPFGDGQRHVGQGAQTAVGDGEISYFEHAAVRPTHSGGPAISCRGRPRSPRCPRRRRAAAPSASTRPWSSTTNRSASRIIACIVCSMMQIVIPCARNRASTSSTLVAFLATQPGQRLVQQQQPGIAGQGAGQLHQAQLLVGELAGGHARLILQPDLMQRPHRRGDASRSERPAP